jgi:CRISPR-associated endonuclease/helicase Cas3
MDYIAHVRRLDDGGWDVPQSLEAHLRGTAELAAGFAGAFDSSGWAYALAMAHDCGKGRGEWQEYIRDKSGFGYDMEAGSETIPGKLEHSGQGARLAEEVFGKGAGRFFAYCIAGHHAGLPDWTGHQSSLDFRLGKAVTSDIAKEWRDALSGLCPRALPRT